jgi:hypothetical protein
LQLSASTLHLHALLIKSGKNPRSGAAERLSPGGINKQIKSKVVFFFARFLALSVAGAESQTRDAAWLTMQPGDQLCAACCISQRLAAERASP